MNNQACEQVQAQIGEYLLGGLPDAEREAIESHVALCPRCACELADTRRALDALDQAGLAAAPTGVADAVVAGVADRLRQGLRPRSRFGWPLAVAAAAACLAVGALGIWLGTRPTGRDAGGQVANERLVFEAQAVVAHARSVLRQLDDVKREYDAIGRMVNGGPGPMKGGDRTEGPKVIGNLKGVGS